MFIAPALEPRQKFGTVTERHLFVPALAASRTVKVQHEPIRTRLSRLRVMERTKQTDLLRTEADHPHRALERPLVLHQQSRRFQPSHRSRAIVTRPLRDIV